MKNEFLILRGNYSRLEITHSKKFYRKKKAAMKQELHRIMSELNEEQKSQDFAYHTKNIKSVDNSEKSEKNHPEKMTTTSINGFCYCEELNHRPYDSCDNCIKSCFGTCLPCFRLKLYIFWGFFFLFIKKITKFNKRKNYLKCEILLFLFVSDSYVVVCMYQSFLCCHKNDTLNKKKRHFETAPNEYSWTNLYLMSILSLLKKGSLLAEEQASRELCWFCPEGHFPKLNFILKLNVNEFNGWAHCRSLGAMQSWYQ